MQKPENFWHTTRSMQHSLILKWLKFFSLLIINAVAGTEEEEDTVGLFIGILGKTNFHRGTILICMYYYHLLIVFFMLVST